MERRKIDTWGDLALSAAKAQLELEEQLGMKSPGTDPKVMVKTASGGVMEIAGVEATRNGIVIHARSV